METTALALLVTLCVTTTLLIFRRTRFTLKPSTGQVWPILIYKEYALIFLPLILIQSYGVAHFPRALFFARDDSALSISIFSISAVFLFSLTVGFVSRVTPLRQAKESLKEAARSKSVALFATSTLILSMLVLVASIFFLNYKHAFFHALITGENVLVARLENVYASALPSQLSHIISLGWWVSGIQAGIFAQRKKFLSALIFFIAGIVLASANGGKAPPVTCLMLAVISYVGTAQTKFRIRRAFLYAPIYGTLIFFVVFWITSFQIRDLDITQYTAFLINRLGIGQMSGVFETFSIDRLQGDFYLHTVPFASLLYDYPIYDKELMLFTEGAAFDKTGVKNSLFISEAYGIGGWPLAALSPLIVGASFGLGSFFLHMFFKKFFDSSIATVYAFPIYLLSSPLTGGFSSFALFKGLILTLMILSVVLFVFKTMKMLKYSYRHCRQHFPTPREMWDRMPK